MNKWHVISKKIETHRRALKEGGDYMRREMNIKISILDLIIKFKRLHGIGTSAWSHVITDLLLFVMVDNVLVSRATLGERIQLVHV